MATVAAKYRKEMAAPVAPEVREHENAMLRGLYRYDDAAVHKELAKLPKARAWRPNMMVMHFDPKAGR